MDNNSNSNSNNNNKNHNIDYISRMIKGITDFNSIRPAVTPEIIPSFLMLNRDTNNINDDNFNSNYNTSLNSPNSKKSDPNVRDSISENLNSENEGFNNNKIKKTEISFHDSESDANRIKMSNKKTDSFNSDPDLSPEKNKKTDSFNSDPDLSPEKVTKSSQSNIKMNTEISNLNKSDNLSSNLKINNIPDVSYKTKIMPETYISNKNNIDFERVLYSKNARNRLQKNQIVKRSYEPTITINIGKITVRYIDNNINKNSKNIKDMKNGMRNSNKLSLTDYLKKRAETNR